MSKYKLINTTTKEEHLCDKVTIDGFDYYVSDEKPAKGEYFYNKIDDEIYGLAEGHEIVYNKELKWDFKIIATNNPNIDIPKVVNEIERLTFQEFKDWSFGEHGPWHTYKMFQKGYSKSQETHPNSDEDMKLFGKFCAEYDYRLLGTKSYEELLQLWKEQQTKIVYYE